MQDFTWKVELHTLASATLTDAEFLTGASGTPVSLTAVLRVPAPPGTTRVPAVVLMHGSSGISGYVDEWSRFLVRHGVATLLVDSFTARGVDTTLADQNSLGRLAMIVDAYRAFDLLAAHPRIDASRIAIMGFSRGGQAALYSAVRRFLRMHGPARGDYAMHIAFYPACHTRYIADEHVVARPIHVLHGTADNFNPIGPCRDYVHRAQRAEACIELHELPGAQHIFDWPLLSRPVVLEGVTSNKGSLLEEREPGVITLRGMSDAEPQFEKSPTFAYDAAAFEASKNIVSRVTRELLGSLR